MPISQPSQLIESALRSSAVKFGVPVSLLRAVAFIESGFRADAQGSKVAAGWTAKGLMQLSPAVITQFAVSDPFNVQMSADGGAAYLAERAKAYDWSVDRMLASYNWGPGNLADAERVRRTAPKEVRDYVRKVKAARYYYEDQAEPVGVSVFDQLANATRGLLELNPTWQPAIELEDNMRRTAADYTEDGLVKRWKEYTAAFERAPLTDATTPAPYKMTPDTWMATVTALRKVSGKVRDIMSPTPTPTQQPLDFGEPIDKPKLQPGAYVLLAALAIFLLSRPGRRA